MFVVGDDGGTDAGWRREGGVGTDARLVFPPVNAPRSVRTALGGVQPCGGQLADGPGRARTPSSKSRRSVG